MRYMADVSCTDRIPSVEVAKRCGLADIQGKMSQRRLQWFGHVRREKEARRFKEGRGNEGSWNFASEKT